MDSSSNDKADSAAEENPNIPTNDNDNPLNGDAAPRRTPFTDLSQVDADLALARTLQEQERAYMMLRMGADGGSDYGSWEAESYEHDDDFDEEDYDESDAEGDAIEEHVHAEGEDDDAQNVVLDPSAFPDDEAYARALQDAEEQDMAARLLALAGINGSEEDEEDHGDNSQDAWEEVDPDELSYEELLALGEVVGTESRGLSPETIASLPSSNYKSQGSQEGISDSSVPYAARKSPLHREASGVVYVDQYFAEDGSSRLQEAKQQTKKGRRSSFLCSFRGCFGVSNKVSSDHANSGRRRRSGALLVNDHKIPTSSEITNDITSEKSKNRDENKNSTIINQLTSSAVVHDTWANHGKLSHSVSLPVLPRQKREKAAAEEKGKKVKEVAAVGGEFDSMLGAVIITVTLVVMIIWGKIWAILCTAAWFYFIPRFRANLDESYAIKFKNDDRVDFDSWEYKKKVVLQGLLHRNQNL
ncbi:RING/U-box superfamily protein [Perilla frutescens var. hirtella]|nr:RING/U-box superfamily protein [Perilla frutescens var. hirtella]